MPPSSSQTNTNDTMTIQNQTQTQTPVLYQVDCTKASSGKTVSITKRRISWRYGYANPTALSNGSTSVECRGHEHEITFVWSIASGKKLVVHDSSEIHYEQPKRGIGAIGAGFGEGGKFEFVWKMGGHVFTLLAYAAPPLKAKHGTWKQFELLIDGCSFDNLPKIYQLGTEDMNRITSRNASRNASKQMIMKNIRDAFKYHPSRSGSSRTSASMYEERRSDVASPREELSWARNIHSLETKRQMNTRSTTPVSAPVVPVPVPTEPQDLLSCDMNLILDSPRDLMSDDSSDLYNRTPTSTASASASSTNPFEYDENDQFNPSVAPTYDVIWSNIMDAYDTGASPSPTAGNLISPTNASANGHVHGHGHMPVVSTSVTQVQTSFHNLTVNTNTDPTKYTDNYHGPNVVSPTDVTFMNAHAHAHAHTTNNTSINTVNGNEIDGAMNNLVNLDDISQPVLTSYNRSKKAEEDQLRYDANRRHLSLAELRESRTTMSTHPNKEVMKTHASYYQNHPGALVVYGQNHNQAQSQGPPPLQTGFGVGVNYSY